MFITLSTVQENIQSCLSKTERFTIKSGLNTGKYQSIGEWYFSDNSRQHIGACLLE